MSTAGKHTPSELLAQFSDGILSNISFFKTEEKNKFNASDFFSVSAVLPTPKSGLPMLSFTFNDVFTYFLIF